MGDPPDLPLGSADPDILIWAEGRGVPFFTDRPLPGRGAERYYLLVALVGVRSVGLAIVLPDDIIGNFTAMVAGVAQSVEQRFCKP